MRFEEFLERYIFVRKCATCSSLVGYENKSDAFCPSCRQRFERAKTDECPHCNRAAIECTCMPKKMSKSGILTLKKLTLYRADRASAPENRLLYFIKNNKNKRVAHFIAEQLSTKVYELLRESGEITFGVSIVFIPRSARAVAKYGFDQSELIVKELSKIVSVPYEKLLVRNRRGKEQKKLASGGREENALKDIALSSDAAVSPDKAYIIFDDIVTSGASMARAAELLREAGARRIYSLAVSRSV